MTSLKIWANNLLSEAARELLTKEVGASQLIIEEAEPAWLTPGKSDPRMQEADVAFGQPDAESIINASKIRWVQVSSAGYTRYDNPRFRTALINRGTVFTNSSEVYSEPCAQHVAAFILADSRQLLAAADSQRSRQAWPQAEIRADSYLLAEQTILILGYGHIGSRLAEILAPFKAKLVGYRRTPKKEGQVPVIGESELPRYLSVADHVVNILPDSPSTQRFFDQSRFGQLKAGARYYSIGRGSTTDQKALANALGSKALSAAYLDVTDPEPLPPDHELWRIPNCCITPHSGGGHHNEGIRLVEHFLRNLKRFEAGEDLLNHVF